MRFNPADLVREGGYFSRPAVVLLLGWGIVLIWYLLDGTPLLAKYPLPDYVAVPFLLLVSGYYFGKYNFTLFTKEAQNISKQLKKKT